jgi:exopolyphosphatase/guanosine-5'-triphosphate,3'-diphosphate pyrophosphatase
MAQREEPLAAIDAGSNTIHLAVARITADGRDLETLEDITTLVRLGADVTASGLIGPERMAHALATLAAQRERAEALSAGIVLGLATEGVRAASNRDEFLKRAREEAGVLLHLLTGEQEAAVTFWGATSGASEPQRSRAVIDLGGGSMELVIGASQRVLWSVSLPIGSGTLLERCISQDPPSGADLDCVRAVVSDTLGPHKPPQMVEEVIACGGTATTLAGLARRALRSRDQPGEAHLLNGLPGSIDVLTQDDLGELIELLAHAPSTEVSARYGVQEARARLLPSGALALAAACNTLGAENMVITRRGIREGAMLACWHRGADWLEAASAGEL